MKECNFHFKMCRISHYGLCDLFCMQIDAETISEPGDPKEIICDYAEKYNVQLLVVGSRGYNAIKRLV